VYLDRYANKRTTLMKKTLFLALLLSVFAAHRSQAQPASSSSCRIVAPKLKLHPKAVDWLRLSLCRRVRL
jgi:hypothetical protein